MSLPADRDINGWIVICPLQDYLFIFFNFLNQLGKQLNYTIKQIGSEDIVHASSILDAINFSSNQRGTGIDPRPKGYIKDKMKKGLGIIAIDNITGDWIGFCTIEVWTHRQFLANTGLIIKPEYRGLGISAGIKSKLFDLCLKEFPDAKILSMTTNPLVMSTNKILGFTEVSFEDVLKDPMFLKGCTSWVDYIELMKKGHTDRHDYVTMIYYPEEHKDTIELAEEDKVFVGVYR